MNKEEILEKSRQANEDEGMVHAENQGRIIGFSAFLILYMMLMVFDLFFGDHSTISAISSLFCIFLAAETYAKYRYAKNKIYLIITIGFSISSLISAATFVISTLLG